MCGEDYKSWSFSYTVFSTPLWTSSLFGPFILLITLFLYTVGLCFSLDVRESFIPVANKNQNYVFYILNLVFLGGKYEEIRNRIGAGSPLLIVCNVHLMSEI